MRAQPYKIGITGTIGSGKSTVGQILTANGVLVLDTDQVVHLLYQKPEVISEIVEAIGTEVFNQATSTVDRQALSKIVFQSPELKQKLEAIVHPKVREETQRFLVSEQTSIIRAVLVPLLFEAKSEALYDEIWCVVVQPESLLIERLKKRHPDWSTEVIQNRLAQQWPQETKSKLANYIVDNSQDEASLRQNVLAQLNRVKEKLVAVSS